MPCFWTRWTRAYRALGTLLCVGVGALGGPGPAGAATAAAVVPAAGAPVTPPRAALQHLGCQTALDPSDRSVSVQAVMRPVPGTRAMRMRIDLLERVGRSGPVGLVRAGDLGTWLSPSPADLGQRPGDVWRLDKMVVNLDAPAGYAFRVSFRWTGSHGRVLARATRRTRLCHQPELRPDLVVRSLSVTPVPGDPGHDRYTAVIADQGVSGAGPFEVLFAPGNGSSPTTDTIAFLGAGQHRELQFTGPVCDPAAPPTVTVDATRQVDDLNRANNTATAVCPAS